ncbi:L,D-transpeptidase family protein [Aureimonas leprariae]|uniref:L,D-transpeptidase family protein n=1 Tax=Plantimonas leprariae TaxID=2615207 RepID=A0A7V7PRU5_9HYPH|nr:L,D-transpeptidase family protein [Aureimonas leprariae]KAB0681443.1 L,D-transpeptidase family protein [Aureimonas leprariae]
MRTILVRRSPSSPTRGVLQAGPLRLPVALGRSGTSVFKREGDGATPVASMPFLFAWRRPGRLRAVRTPLPVRFSRSTDGWCDAPSHAAYNRAVRLPHPASAETMRRADRLYDFVAVLDWNVRRRARGLGSAIFLHVAKEGFEPTAGCVALDPRDVVRLAPLLRRNSRLRVIR